jgi:hypothetical protein
MSDGLDLLRPIGAEHRDARRHNVYEEVAAVPAGGFGYCEVEHAIADLGDRPAPVPRLGDLVG